jgi:uncharacterized membrane protein (Fun14 family)
LILLNILGIFLATIQITIQIIHGFLNLQEWILIRVPLIPTGVFIDLNGIGLLLQNLSEYGFILAPPLDIIIVSFIVMDVYDIIEVDWNRLELLREGLFSQILHIVTYFVELWDCESKLPFCEVLPGAKRV